MFCMKNFVIIGLALFFVGETTYLAFNAMFFRPDKVFTVRFNEVPPIMKIAGDVGVYYRGYKVGKATCRKLSKDQKHIIFCIEINYKDLRLPKNTQVILKTQDIFGDRYFDLIYPKNPSDEMLVSGDVIEGTAVYERVDKYLVEELESGKLGMLISNLNYLTGGIRTFIEGDEKTKEKIGEITGSAAESVEDVSGIAKELRAMLKNPRFKKSLLQAPEALVVTSAQLAVTNRMLPVVNKNLEDVEKSFLITHEDFEKTNRNLMTTNDYLPGVNDSLEITNPLLCNTNQQLGTLNPKIPVIPQDVIWQADRTLKRYDCIGWALSKTMSKNCLFFRFLFGKPGEPFEHCVCP